MEGGRGRTGRRVRKRDSDRQRNGAMQKARERETEGDKQ